MSFLERLVTADPKTKISDLVNGDIDEARNFIRQFRIFAAQANSGELVHREVSLANGQKNTTVVYPRELESVSDEVSFDITVEAFRNEMARRLYTL